jgi:LmbE family N-acetylglucosaminyl deacetylase
MRKVEVIVTSAEVSLVGHFITVLSFFGVAVYAYIRHNELRRTTRRSPYLFYVVLGLSLLFALINLYRFLYEILGGSDGISAHILDVIAEFSGILVQSALILVLFANKIIVEPATSPGRILAIGAHPDDIEIAAGAALAKMRDAGYYIQGLVLSQGEQGGHPDVRPGEAIRGAQFLGLDQAEVLNFTDTRLSEQSVDITKAIEAAIKKVEPDIIFTHSNHDLHQDHLTVYEATLRAARNTPITILCYESPSVTPDFHPVYFIEVCNYVDVKIEAMREHWDQRKKPYMKSDLVRGKLAFRGGQAKVEYAEGFEVARMVSRV